MKMIIKYFFLLWIVVFPSVFFLLSKFLYDIYVKILYSGKEFYGEMRGDITIDVITYVVFPLSIVISFLFSCAICKYKNYK